MTNPILIAGDEIRSLMQCHRVTIRDLARSTGITMKRIREVRESGLSCHYAARDWIQAITGTDPGAWTPYRQLAS